MTLHREIIETFFGRKFENSEPLSSEVRNQISFFDFYHFDGAVHWHVIIEEPTKYIRVEADITFPPSSFPILEVDISYIDVSLSEASGIGPVLLIHPTEMRNSHNLIAITRTPEGRFSFSAGIGNFAGDDL